MASPFYVMDDGVLISGKEDSALVDLLGLCCETLANEETFLRWKASKWLAWNFRHAGGDLSTWLEDVERLTGQRPETVATVLRDFLGTYPENVWTEVGSPAPGELEALPVDLSSLRDSQREALEILEGTPRSGWIALSGGSGKTRLALTHCAMRTHPCVVLVPDELIRTQWISEAAAAGLPKGAVAKKEGSRIRVLLEKEFLACAELPPLVWVDEAHQASPDVLARLGASRSLRRLGLSATPVVPDELCAAFASAFGPVLFRKTGSSLVVHLVEVRVPMKGDLRASWLATRAELSKRRLLAGNPLKVPAARAILALHAGRPALVLSDVLGPLAELAAAEGRTVLDGTTPTGRRKKMIAEFREAKVDRLYASAVLDVGIDLPDAEVLVQISARGEDAVQEEQRLGRLLRPRPGKKDVHFYVLVTEGSPEETQARERRARFEKSGGEVSIRRFDPESLALTPASGSEP